MSKSLLITRPQYDDTTWYLSQWSEKIIHFAKKKQIPVIDLNRQRATRRELESVLAKREPNFVMLNGHGGDDCVAGENGEIIADRHNASLFKGKIIYSRSCRSAKRLGKESIKRGCFVYIGYKEDFIFMYDPARTNRSLEDKTAKLFLEPSNSVSVYLLKSHCAGEAHQKSRQFFLKNIEKILTEGPSSENYPAIRFLYWDSIHQVCLGNQNAVL